MSTQPTDVELIAELEVSGVAFMKFRGGLGGTKEVWITSGSQDAKKIAQGMRAAIAKWGQPAQAAEPFCWHWENTFNGGMGVVKKNPETLGINMTHPDHKWTALYTAPQPVAREPLSDDEVDSLCKVGPVYAPDGKVTLTPPQYRYALESAQRYGLRKGERAHGINKRDPHVE